MATPDPRAGGGKPSPLILGIVGGVLVLGLLVGWLVGHYAGSSSSTTVTVAAPPENAASIQKAPNFSAADLSALPTDDWPTVGGSLLQERYSPLDQVNTSNVAQLKGVWMTHLNGSALAAKYSAESQPVVYKGVIYITTGNNDVFAVGVARATPVRLARPDSPRSRRRSPPPQSRS
jgi:glucose dehydrogenase